MLTRRRNNKSDMQNQWDIRAVRFLVWFVLGTSGMLKGVGPVFTPGEVRRKQRRPRRTNEQVGASEVRKISPGKRWLQYLDAAVRSARERHGNCV